MLDNEEFERWFATAKHTLEAAKLDLNNGYYNWACFKAHQCAEFAVKALARGVGNPLYGHSIHRILKKLSDINLKVPEKLISKAKTLDQYYTPTRYPDSWTEGTPYEYYTQDDAKRAINFCYEILKWVESIWKELLIRGKKREKKR